jgi:hypothetical protein
MEAGGSLDVFFLALFLGFAFPLFGEQMFARFGYGGGNSLLACLVCRDSKGEMNTTARSILTLKLCEIRQRITCDTAGNNRHNYYVIYHIINQGLDCCYKEFKYQRSRSKSSSSLTI